MRFASLLLASLALGGCASQTPLPPAAPVPAASAAPVTIETVLQKQIYQMTPVEAGRYVAWVHTAEPDSGTVSPPSGARTWASHTC